MKKIRYGFIVIISIITAAVSPVAIAAETTSSVSDSATIDWSKLQLSFTNVNDSTSTANFSNYNTWLGTYAQSGDINESNLTTIIDWTENGNSAANVGTSNASAVASALNLSGTATSTGDSMESSGARTVEFSVDGPGLVTVTVPYTLSFTGGSPDCSYCFNMATVIGQADFYSLADNGGNYSSSSSTFSLTPDYWDPASQTQSGTLVFGIYAAGPGFGSIGVGFDLAAQGVSVVPEPESYAMLLAGLGVMGAIARRRNKNKSL